MHPRRNQSTAAVGLLALCGTVWALPTPEEAAQQPAEGWARPVGGEPAHEVELTGDDKLPYRAGPCVVESPLPEGYPPPTAPGAIELKHYPSVRRAEYGGDAGAGFRGFFPLFRHISRRDIAMTAPVEMDFEEDGTTMSFLYRVPELGPTGEAENGVRVVDTEPALVLAIGMQGPRNQRTIDAARQKLDAWLAESDAYTATDRARWVGYNGPSVPVRNQWWELHLFVEPAAETEAAPQTDPATDTATDANAPTND